MLWIHCLARLVDHTWLKSDLIKLEFFDDLVLLYLKICIQIILHFYYFIEIGHVFGFLYLLIIHESYKFIIIAFVVLHQYNMSLRFQAALRQFQGDILKVRLDLVQVIL